MDDEREQVQQTLLPGEHALWIGRPDPRVIFAPADGFLIAFGVFFLGFSIFWVVGVSHSRASGPFVFFGVPFMVIGLYYLFGRFFVKALTKRRTVYAITNRRALIITGAGLVEGPIRGQQRTIRRSINRTHMSVTFGQSSKLGLFNNRQQIPNSGLDFMSFGAPRPVAFYDVDDVQGLTSALTAADLAA